MLLEMTPDRPIAACGHRFVDLTGLTSDRWVPYFFCMTHTVREKKKLIARVSRIRGQVEAIERALAEEAGCDRIMHMIAGIRGSVAGLCKATLRPTTSQSRWGLSKFRLGWVRGQTKLAAHLPESRERHLRAND